MYDKILSDKAGRRDEDRSDNDTKKIHDWGASAPVTLWDNLCSVTRLISGSV